MASLPPEVLDIVKQKSATSGVKEELIARYFEKLLNDPEYTSDFASQKDLINYISMVLEGHINQWINQRIETFDLLIICAQKIIPKKEGKSTFCKYLCIGTSCGGEPGKYKKLVVTHFSDVKKFKALDMLHISLKMRKPIDDNTLDATYDDDLEYSPIKLPWVTDPKEFVRAQLQKNTTDIISAGQHLSMKDTNNGNAGYTKPFELRLVRGVVDGIFGTRLNLIDNSIEKNREFMKSTQIADPKDPSKKITKWGGFTVWCDEEKQLGRGSLVDVIGYINDAHNMSAWAIFPIKIIEKKKPSERLQKPGQTPQTPQTQISGAISPLAI